MAIDPDKQLPGGPTTVNEQWFDALVRHQIGLLRLSGSIRDKVQALLDKTEEDMATKIARRLANHKSFTGSGDTTRLALLLKSIKATRLRAWDQVTETWVRELREVAKVEPAFLSGALKTVSPVIVDTVLPSVGLLSTLVTARPFEGKTLRSWARSMRAADIARIEDQIRVGMVQGESSAAIARRVVGTRSQAGADGATALTRRQAEALTITAVNAISNAAKREFYKANPGLFEEELYVATLDSNTTPVCRSLDGKRFPVGKGPLPPLHFRCRSLRIAVIGGEAIGKRPARRHTKQQLLREYAARANLKPVSNRSKLPRGHKGLFDDFSRSRMRELTGTVPAKVTYQTWLERQSATFQDDVLGKTKGTLFRRGKLPLDRFVNRRGDELSLRELASRERQAFVDAGLDPEDFL